MVFCRKRSLEVGGVGQSHSSGSTNGAWPVLIVHLKGGTRGDHWRGTGLFWVKRTGTRSPDVESIFQARVSTVHMMGWSFWREVCVSHAFSVSRWSVNEVIDEPREESETEREQRGSCSIWLCDEQTKVEVPVPVTLSQRLRSLSVSICAPLDRKKESQI